MDIITTAKNYRPVSRLSVDIKVLEKPFEKFFSEKLVSNRIVDHLQKCGLFPDFHNSFWSSRTSADLLIVVSDRIARFLSGRRLLEL